MLVFFVDQISKSWGDGNLRLWERHPILGDFLVLARGLIRASTSPYVSLTVLLGLLTVFWVRRRRASLTEMVSFALVFGGGLSNLFSQWRSEFIVDIFQIYLYRGQYFPFNLADVAILGGGTFAVGILTKKIFVPEPASPFLEA